VVQIAISIIVLIDLATSLFFLLAFILSFYNYNTTRDKGNSWLIVSIVFVFTFIVSISNVLEWAEITSALDPAEDFINMLVVVVWVYIWYQLK
jgi:hypothetical protein